MLINDQLSVVKEVQPSQGEQTESVHAHYYFHVHSVLWLFLDFWERHKAVHSTSCPHLAYVDHEIEKYKGGWTNSVSWGLLDGQHLQRTQSKYF